MPKQFVLPFANSPEQDTGNFIVAPCNQQALGFLGRWPDWPAPAVALFGPAGCGKSHLARIWRSRADARLVSAGELAANGAQANLFSGAWVIEDMDRLAPDAARDHVLMHLFENPGTSLLLTGRLPPPQWPAATGDWRSRLQSLIALEISSPDDRFLTALVERQFAARQLQVPGSVVNRILTHVERTPDAVARFVETADLKALSEKRPVSLRLVTEMLDEFDEVGGSATVVTPSSGLAP
jgi:chromosomal replication initiation ATPase DnaA